MRIIYAGYGMCHGMPPGHRMLHFTKSFSLDVRFNSKSSHFS